MTQRTPNSVSPSVIWGCLCALIAATLWAYWPAISAMTSAWSRNPDYSHGYLVAPLAAFFLYARRGRLDATKLRPSMIGAASLLVIGLARVMAGGLYLGPVDAWTLPLTLMGVFLLVLGWNGLAWSWPSLAFLYFMIPIPYSAETWLSVPLQQVATTLSTEVLQLLGWKALAEGNVIWLGEHPIDVARACSGLRIMVGVFALAFAFVLFSKWEWWQKALVLVAAIPVALVANALRIVVTAILVDSFSDEAAQQFSHDFAGFVMIPVAALLFWAFLKYLDELFPEVHAIRPSDFIGSK